MLQHTCMIFLSFFIFHLEDTAPSGIMKRRFHVRSLKNSNRNSVYFVRRNRPKDNSPIMPKKITSSVSYHRQAGARPKNAQGNENWKSQARPHSCLLKNRGIILELILRQIHTLRPILWRNSIFMSIVWVSLMRRVLFSETLMKLKKVL